MGVGEASCKKRVHLTNVLSVGERVGDIKRVDRDTREREERLSEIDSRKSPSTWVDKNTLLFIIGMFDEFVNKNVIDTIFVFVRGSKLFIFIYDHGTQTLP